MLSEVFRLKSEAYTLSNLIGSKYRSGKFNAFSDLLYCIHSIHFINLVVIGFMLWLWFGTYYRLDATHIHYRCGPFRGKIAIDAIREVQRDTTIKPVGPSLRTAIVFNQNGYKKTWLYATCGELLLEEYAYAKW